MYRPPVIFDKIRLPNQLPSTKLGAFTAHVIYRHFLPNGRIE